MTRVPKVQEVVLEIFGKTPRKGVNPDDLVAMVAAIQGCKGVNPDDLVAMGAAIQGGILRRDDKNLLLLDLPVELRLIPTKKSKSRTTKVISSHLFSHFLAISLAIIGNIIGSLWNVSSEEFERMMKTLEDKLDVLEKHFSEGLKQVNEEVKKSNDNGDELVQEFDKLKHIVLESNSRRRSWWWPFY